MVVPPGRFPTVLSAERLNRHGTWQYRDHTVHGITRLGMTCMPPVIDKM